MPQLLTRVLAAAMLLAFATAPALAATTYIPIIIPQAPPTVPGAQTADYSSIHSVAVVSAIGDHITLQNIHVLTSPSKVMDISDWNVDAGVEARLRQYLSSRFTFKDVMYDRGVLAKMPNGPLNGPGAFLDFIKALPHDGIDAFLVVRPDKELGTPGLEGLALLDNGGPALWANYEIDLVDAQSGKQLAKAYSRLQLRANQSVGFAGVPAGAGMKLDDDFKMTPAQTLALRSGVASVLNISLVETLRALNFGVTLPAPGTRTVVAIPPDRDPYKAYKNVAVVSALGTGIGLHHMGGTIFSQDHFQADEPDWHLDAYLEGRLRDALARHFTIVEPKVDRAAFAAAQIWGDDSKLAPSFPGLSSDPGIDMYVVIVPLGLPIMAFNVAAIKGVGVFDRSAVVGPDTTVAYAHYAVAAIDAHTMKILLARAAILGPDHANIEPYEDVGHANWPAQPPALAPEQASAIHDKILDLLNQSLDETLLQMALLGVIAADGPPPPGTSVASVPGPGR